MIEIGGKTIEAMPAQEGFEPNALMHTTFDTMKESSETYRYDTPDQLIFELRLRNAVVQAARDLSHSGLNFAVFRDAKANPDFWTVSDEGGFALKSGVKPSDAIRDIYAHGSQYATECATAMVIVYYKAILDVFPEDLFNKTYGDIYLMNWEKLDRNLAVVEADNPSDVLPGDAKYFQNPDVDPLHPEWQGENVFYLGGGRYYGHGIGVADADKIVRELNKLRKDGATQSAFLMDEAKRQNYKKLEGMLHS